MCYYCIFFNHALLDRSAIAELLSKIIMAPSCSSAVFGPFGTLQWIL